MSTAPEVTSALALIVAGRDVPVPSLPAGNHCVLERAGTGEQGIEVARDTRPEVILISDTLTDMSCLDVCRALRSDPTIRQVPLLLYIDGPPSPEQRVAALREGVWDFISRPVDGGQLALRLLVYSQAKRNLDEVRATEGLELGRQLRSSAELSRQAQRLGALMARLHASMACVVFEIDHGTPDMTTGSLIARTTRASDVVGVLSPGRIGILAPATEHGGAVQLALRIAREVRRVMEVGGVLTSPSDGVRLVAGIDAVTNAKYSPLDPMRLIQRASAAARTGVVEPGQLWLRHHREDEAPSIHESIEHRTLQASRSTER